MFRLRIINCSSKYTEPGIQSLGCEILDTAAPGWIAHGTEKEKET